MRLSLPNVTWFVLLQVGELAAAGHATSKQTRYAEFHFHYETKMEQGHPTPKTSAPQAQARCEEWAYKSQREFSDIKSIECKVKPTWKCNFRALSTCYGFVQAAVEFKQPRLVKRYTSTFRNSDLNEKACQDWSKDLSKQFENRILFMQCERSGSLLGADQQVTYSYDGEVVVIP
jgi:hypothetical protein